MEQTSRSTPCITKVSHRDLLLLQRKKLIDVGAWGGLVSSASYITGAEGFDFGNTYYNDHHFHYGYHILAAAYIGAMDSSWLATNKAYVNHLVRDFANPSRSDSWYPQWRAFDWYHGHSWATGLFDQLDGKVSIPTRFIKTLLTFSRTKNRAQRTSWQLMRSRCGVK